MQTQGIEDAQIAADAVEASAFVKAANHVHPCVEEPPVAGERLEAAAGDGVLFQDGDAMPFFGEECRGEEAADAAADDEEVLHE